MNDFRNHTLVELLNEVFTYYNRNWEAEGEAQKYYCIAKTLFVRKVKRAGRSARLAYNYIRCVEENLAADDDVSLIINVDFLDELERNIR